MKHVKVEWIDSCSGLQGWTFTNQQPKVKPIMITTLGVICKKTKKSIRVAQSHSNPMDQIHNYIDIPLAVVKSIRRIK